MFVYSHLSTRIVQEGINSRIKAMEEEIASTEEVSGLSNPSINHLLCQLGGYTSFTLKILQTIRMAKEAMAAEFDDDDDSDDDTGFDLSRIDDENPDASELLALNGGDGVALQGAIDKVLKRERSKTEKLEEKIQKERFSIARIGIFASQNLHQ
jgi:hypothetical protein